jgi:hypothetical protein
LDAASSSGHTGYEDAEAVTVDPLGIPQLDGRVSVDVERCEDCIFRVTEDPSAFNAERSSS